MIQIHVVAAADNDFRQTENNEIRRAATEKCEDVSRPISSVGETTAQFLQSKISFAAKCALQILSPYILDLSFSPGLQQFARNSNDGTINVMMICRIMFDILFIHEKNASQPPRGGAERGLPGGTPL